MALDFVREIALSDSPLFFDGHTITGLYIGNLLTGLDNPTTLYNKYFNKVREQLTKSDVSEDIMRSKDFELIVQNTYLKEYVPKTKKYLLYDAKTAL